MFLLGYYGLCATKLRSDPFNIRPLLGLLVATIFRNDLTTIDIFLKFVVVAACLISLWIDSCSAQGTKNDRHSFNDLAQFLGNFPYGCAVKIPNTSGWAFTNRALSEALKCPDSDAAEKRMDSVLEKIPSDSEGISEVFVELKTPSLLLLWVTSTKVPWGNNTCAATLYVVLNLSKVRSEATIAERTRIFRALSHELRTPINGTLNALEQCKALLKGWEAGENCREVLDNLEIATCSTNLLLNKYNDLLVTLFSQRKI